MASKVYLGMIADIMHPGLINIINEGAKYGDVIIGLYKDKAIKIVLNTPSAAGLSINELIKTCNKQKVIYQEDMLFGVKRKLHVEVVHYGK